MTAAGTSECTSVPQVSVEWDRLKSHLELRQEGTYVTWILPRLSAGRPPV